MTIGRVVVTAETVDSFLEEDPAMTRSANRVTIWALLTVGLLAAGPSWAQYRGEEIVGTIKDVGPMGNLIIGREGAPDVRVRVSAHTQVVFTDRGDRRDFPNPNVEDLKPGMGVRFVFGSGLLDRIQVHYVPAHPQPRHEILRPNPVSAEKMKVRIESVSRDRRQIQADVAGRRETFQLEASLGRFGQGDLVVVTVQDRGRDGITITRIESAELVGRVRFIDMRRGAVTIEVDGRDETYDVERDLLRRVREGDRVRFEVEERGRGGKAITELRRY
jgi:cold shock CspA family protein